MSDEYCIFDKTLDKIDLSNVTKKRCSKTIC